MATLPTTLDQYNTALAAGWDVDFSRATNANQNNAGQMFSLWWTGIGSWPPAAAQPTGSITYDHTTLGALNFPSPGAGLNWYLARMDLCSSAAVSCVWVIDRLCSIGGGVGNVTTSQTMATPTLPTRGNSGAGVMMMLECYSTSTLGATASILTVTYTNQAGTGSRTASTTSMSWGGAGTVGRCVILPLAAGDTGVQSVQSVQFGTNTTAAGAFAITLFRPIRLAIANGVSRLPTDGFGCNLQKIDPLSCLSFIGVSSSADTGTACLAQGVMTLIPGP